jgi:hypothetical protein
MWGQSSSRLPSRPYLNSPFPRMKREPAAPKTPTRHCAGTLDVQGKVFGIHRAEKLHCKCTGKKPRDFRDILALPDYKVGSKTLI